MANESQSCKEHLTTLQRTMTLLTSITLLLTLFLSAEAQFGVPKRAEEAEPVLHEPGSVVDEKLVGKLQSANDQLTDQQAIDIAYLLEHVSRDPETQLLLQEMRSGTGQQEFADFVGELDPSDIVQGLAVSLEEMKMLDYLFQDPDRALKEMLAEDLIEEHMVETYQADPSLLEEDVRKAVYFNFVSMGAAGGYL